MLVCEKCGKVIEDNKLGYGYEPHGERTPNGCSCGGYFVQATECAVCGTWFDNEGLHGVCEVCLTENELVGTALDIGADNTESVEGINGFIASVLSVEEINKILGKWVEEHFTDHSKEVIKYCYEDKSYYAEWLAKNYGG